MTSLALLDTMKITSIPIICFMYVVSAIGRRIFRSNSEDLDQGSSGTDLKNITSFQFVSCFLFERIGEFFWGVWESAIKDQTNTVAYINNIFQIEKSEIFCS